MMMLSFMHDYGTTLRSFIFGISARYAVLPYGLQDAHTAWRFGVLAFLGRGTSIVWRDG
jgi:hypothetical protein